MRNRRFKYEKTFPCGCAGGKKSCGVLGAVSYPEFGSVEIGFSTKKERYQGNTKNPHVHLDIDEVIKLKNFLQITLDKFNASVKK